MAIAVPGFEASGVLVPYAVIAVSMVVVTILVFGLVLAIERRPPLLTQMLLALAVIGGGSVLLAALVFVFVNPNGTVAWTYVLMAFNFMMAVPVGLWFVALVVYRDRRVGRRGWLWPLALGAATTGSEVLMGVLFAVGEASGPLSVLEALGNGLSSVWYYGSMGAVMAGLILWARLRPTERTVAVGLLATALAAPWVSAYPTVGGVAVAGLMAIVIAAILLRVVGHRVDAAEAPFLLGISVAFVAMTLAGLGLAVGSGSALARTIFGTVMGLVMTAEIAFLVRRCYADAPDSAPAAAETDRPAAPGPASV